MIDLNQVDIESVLKLLSGVTALFALILKVLETISNSRRRQSIKIDLEILELLKKQEGTDIQLLKNNLDNRISKLYADTSSKIDNFRNFLVGMILFLGFSWWSINIFSSQEYFNGKIILTGLMAAIGLTLMFDTDGKKRKNKTNESPFFVFEISKKSDFLIGFALFIVFGLITWAIIYKNNGFSFWTILSGVFSIIGLGVIISEMKLKIKK